MLDAHVKLSQHNSWADLIESIDKSHIPVEFVRQIEFLYPENSVTLDMSLLTNEERHALGKSIQATNTKNIKFHLDLDKIKHSVTAISQMYFSKG